MISVIINVANAWIINVMPTNDFGKTVQIMGLPLLHPISSFWTELTTFNSNSRRKKDKYFWPVLSYQKPEHVMGEVE